MIRLQWIGLLTILRKESIRIFRIWTQTLLPSVVTMTLYFLIFGTFIGSRVGMVHHFTYMQFIVPGLVMMAVVTNAYSNVVSSVFSAKFQKSIEEILVSPLSSHMVILGYVGGGLTRGVIVGFLVTAVSLFFSPMVIQHPFLVVASLILTATLFSLGGFINAIFARKFDDIAIVPTFVLTPLTYLGGVFYSVEHLSPLFRQLSLLNPILYLVNVFRFGFLGVSDIQIVPAFIGLLGLVVVLWTWCWILLERGVGIRQ